MNDAQTLTETPTTPAAQDATKTALEGIDQLKAHAKEAPGPLFCPVDQTGEVRISRLRGESVAYILKSLRKAAGIDHFSAHDLRRTTVTDLLSAGVDVLTVQKLAGQADVTTTARYDRRGEHAKRRAVQSLSLPVAA